MANPVMTWDERLQNMNEKNRRNDAFYVTFLGIPENISNILGRQVKSLTRPTFEFMITDKRYRGEVYKDRENLNYTPMSVTFYDDENSIVSAFLNMQVFRQLNKQTDKFGRWGVDRDYRFDIQIQLFNSSKQCTEEFIVRRCFIQSLNHSDPDISDDSDCEITVMFEFDNIDIKLFDELLSVNVRSNGP